MIFIMNHKRKMTVILFRSQNHFHTKLLFGHYIGPIYSYIHRTYCKRVERNVIIIINYQELCTMYKVTREKRSGLRRSGGAELHCWREHRHFLGVSAIESGQRRFTPLSPTVIVAPETDSDGLTTCVGLLTASSDRPVVEDSFGTNPLQGLRDR